MLNSEISAKAIGSSTLNPLSDDKILGLPKLKAPADDKLNVTKGIKVVFHGTENIVGKGENAGYHNVFFKRLFPPVCQKSSLCGKGLILIITILTLSSLLIDCMIESHLQHYYSYIAVAIASIYYFQDFLLPVLCKYTSQATGCL